MTRQNDGSPLNSRKETPAAEPTTSSASETTSSTERDARKHHLPRWLIGSIAGAIALALIAGGFVAGTVAALTIGAGRGSCDAESVANRVLPSVVTIVAGRGNGSGQVITSDGYILTNNHVISSAAASGSVVVRFSNGHELPARIIGRDPKTDLAVVKVDSDEELQAIEEGDSGSLSVGQPVVALGAPLGLHSTVTAGIVSALGRSVPVPSDDGRNAILVGAIQTDASINPGNSGGALVDCRGRLVGINTAISSVPGAGGQNSTGSVGIGFAIPQAVAIPLAHQLIEHGKVTYPNIGADLIPIPHAATKHFGVDNGLFVQATTNDGPADAAGIRPGDIITRINGREAVNLDVLTHVQLTSEAGDTVTLDYVRGGDAHTAEVTLAD